MKGFSLFILLKNILKYCFFPIFWLLKKARDKYLVYLRIHNPKKLASYYYWSAMNKKLDWKNPVDINEKITTVIQRNFIIYKVVFQATYTNILQQKRDCQNDNLPFEIFILNQLS